MDTICGTSVYSAMVVDNTSGDILYITNKEISCVSSVNSSSYFLVIIMNKKQERIALIALAVFLVGYFCYQVAYATNELAPIPGQSAAYNAGFSQGYMGMPFKV